MCVELVKEQKRSKPSFFSGGKTVLLADLKLKKRRNKRWRKEREREKKKRGERGKERHTFLRSCDTTLIC